MSEQKETVHTTTNVTLTTPQGEAVHFVVQDIVPFALFAQLRSNPNMNWYTNINLKTKKGTSILPKTDLNAEIENDSLEVSVEILPWNSQTVFQHAQQFARMIFSLTKRGEITDCEESLVSWLGRTFGKSSMGKGLPKESDFAGVLPPSFLKKIQPRIVKHFDLANIQNLNDSKMFYQFAVTTHEREEFIIKSNENGFFVNEGKYFKSIYDLMLTKSSYFAENATFVAIRWNSLHVLERTAFTPLDRKTIFSTTRKIENLNGQKNKFDKLELFKRPTEQISGTLRDFLKNDAFPPGHLKAINEGEDFYLRMVFDGIKKIVKGEIPEACEGHRTYIYNGIVISAIDEYAGLYANVDEANRELSAFAKSALDVQKVDSSVEVDRPIVIDYIGQRYVVVFHKDECVFGYGPEHTEFVENEKFNEFIEKLKKQFNFEKISQTSRGFMSDDGQPILTHVGILTPRDYNYPDPEKHAGYRIRSELIRPFEIHKALLNHEDELKALGGLPEYEYTNPDLKDEEQLKKLSEKRSDIILEAPALTYDINALTIYEEKETPENIKEIALYLTEVALPKFIQSFVNSTPYSFDGAKLSQQMHKSGVNVRYLGKLIPLLDQTKALHLSVVRIIECEMIVRAYKCIARENRHSLEQIMKNIKTLVTQGDGFDNLFEEICEMCQLKFNAKPNKPIELMGPYLKRSLLLTFGIVLYLQNGELPLEITNIAEINPRIKFQFSQNFDLNARVQFATNLYQANDLKDAYQLFYTSAQIAENTTSKFNTSLMNCHFYLGLIYFQQKQIELAYDSLIKSLIIEERYTDDTNPDIIFKLTMLGMLSVASKNPRQAFAFYARAASATQLMSPFHTWTIKTASDTAESIMSVDGNVAIQYAQTAIDNCKRVNGTPLMLANSYIAAGNIAFEADKLNLANKFVEEASKYTKSEELNKLRTKIFQKQQKHTGLRRNKGTHH
ncbi:hypothetical protein TRFO_25067 [Tritrichomonas foetus]|uniref:CLU central domain-containing protein n=1 Tax=Tritrichomonas foetus TaxID=1144522 RepID=A0A1J4K7G3_9EUKA|nr:hypothetical protein TRFO_25067 [Tritrichomonas foetus]|eukprot:OHT06824.1 hypothetical protein TRFO_25067 [Tritrichomonas foetus]